MGNVRPLNSKRYEISRNRFWELYYRCLQYDEWKEELKHLTDTLKSIQVTDMPHGTGIGDPTKNLAIRREDLSRQCEIIEETTKEADAEIWEYILKGVTDASASYNYLRTVMNIPCGRNYYHTKRRKFYYLLSKKI